MRIELFACLGLSAAIVALPGQEANVNLGHAAASISQLPVSPTKSYLLRSDYRSANGKRHA
jgi:hypothetical protein